MSDGGVGGLVQLLTQDLQLGEALDKTEGDSAGLSASRSRLESFIVSDKQITADKTGGHAELYTLIITNMPSAVCSNCLGLLSRKTTPTGPKMGDSGMSAGGS